MAKETNLSQINVDGADSIPAANFSDSLIQPAVQSTVQPAIQATQPPAPTTFSLRSFATEQGYDPAAFKDDAELAAALFQAADQVQQIEPLANIGRQFAPYADKLSEIEEFLKTKEAENAIAEKAAKAAEPPPIDWRKTEYDPALERYCELDPQTGLYKPLHPDWAGHARKLNDALEARRYNSQRIIDDLPGILDQYYKPRETSLREMLLKEVKELLQQELSSRQQQTETDNWIKEREKDLYTLDTNGKLVIGLDGQPQLSLKGEALRKYADELSEAGLKNPQKIREYAWLAVSADEAAGKFGKLNPPADQTKTIGQSKRFLDRMTGNDGKGRLQQRGGRIPDDTAPNSATAPPSTDLREIVDRIANEQGIKL